MIGTVIAATFCVALWTIVLVFDLPVWIAIVGTLLVLAGGAAIFLWRRLRALRASREIERSLADQADRFASRARPDQQPEIAALRAEFDRAAAAIRSSKLGKGGGGTGALYALPWYVIIGPPGAGKSTAIRNSGLNFPYQTARGPVRGIGGTRNCDWWLANEAVILDTAGRYAVEEDDHDEWLSFLDMLKRTRVRRPINGVLLALSVEVLVQASEAEIEATALKLRARLDEVIARLGLVPPVYLVFTKCDRLSGFIETFGDLRRSERSQVWGMTLPLSARDAHQVVDLVGSRFERLCQVLERRALEQIAAARQVEKRERIYALPEEFEALRGPLVRLVDRLFADNVYQDAPVVRGVYFTSGTQEGGAIGRAVSAMASAYGLTSEPAGASAAADQPKSYFLGDLFSTILFPDANLAGASAGALRKRRWMELCVATGLIVAALVAAALPAFAYVTNRKLLGEVESAIRGTAERTRDTSALAPLSLLDPLRAVVLTLVDHQKEGVPAGYGMGLYQGAKLLPHVERFYTSTVRARVVGPYVRAAAAQLEDFADKHEMLNERPTVAEHAQMYDLLKSYLLLTSPKAAGEPSLDEAMRSWLTGYLVSHPSPDLGESTLEQQRALRSNLEAYLELLAHDPSLGFARDARAIQRTRALLNRIPAVQLAVDRIISELDPLGWDLTLDQLVGGTGLPLTGAVRVRGAFTRRAWEEHLRELLADVPQALLGEPWVLEGQGNPSQEETKGAQRRCQLRAEYFSRYIESWKQFLGGLRMEEPRDKNRAVVVLQDLTRGQPPPLERLARNVAYHAQLDEKKPSAPDAKATEVASKWLAKIAGGPAVAAAAAAAGMLGEKDPCLEAGLLTNMSVRRALYGFYAFGAPDDPAAASGAPAATGQLSAAQIYQEQLAFVRDAIQAYSDNPGTGEALLGRLQAASSRIKTLVDSQEVGWRPRFDALLWPPLNGAGVASSGDVAAEKGDQWCTSVVLPFDRSLRGRYPFSRSGQDAALSDVAEFYRPGSGILWSAFESTLARDVSRTGDRYDLKLGSAVASMYSGQLVDFLNRSQAITTALFPNSSEKPSVAFEVRVRPSPGIASVMLTIDGQVVDFHNGPERWVPIRWPGEDKKRGAHMRIRGAEIDEVINQDGEWGLFRLIDSGIVSGAAGERFFTVRFRLRTQNDVTIDIRPARVDHPFLGKSGRPLEAFRASDVDAPRSITSSRRACGP